MKNRLIRYLSLVVFSCTLALNLNTQCIDNPVKLPSQLSLLLPVTLVYAIVNATKKVSEFFTKSQAVPATPVSVSEFSKPATPVISTSQISEGISLFCKEKYELGLKKGGEFIEAFNNATPIRAGYFAWNHKGKIALTLGALALYKKYKENDNNKRPIHITNQSGARIIINKA